jgi:sodium-dependent dicarboxylate transporter 2/3/5
MTAAEWRILIIFIATALLWILREPVPGWGWATLLGLDKQNVDGKSVTFVDDSTVAIGMALVCFLIPSGRADRRPLLTWESTVRVPWGVLLLFGGGLALAEGMDATGLSDLLGGRLAGGLSGMGDVARTAAIATGVTGLTEVTSNLACVQMILPVLKGAADTMQIDPKLLMVPAVIAASSGFMMPVGTPPNAIAYGSGQVRMADMLKAGLLLNIAGVVLVVLLALIALN